MKLQHDVALKPYTTMRIGGPARFFVELNNREQLDEITSFIENESISHYVLGEGSNTIFSDNGFDGIIILNKIKGYETTDETDQISTVKIGAGENWDGVVAKAVESDLSGIEALSAIPGTAGATPVQNVGAYGQEIAHTLVSLEAYDLKSKKIVELDNTACEFSYRDSIFKSTAKNRYIILSITLRLNKSNMEPPFYASLQKHLDDKDINEFTPQTIRDAVTHIRQHKLPDPSLVANSGSFFKNPVVSQEKFAKFAEQHPGAPHFELNDEVKIPAGWLIEEAGLKGYGSGHFSTYNLNSLVITNDGKGTFSELNDFVNSIQTEIKSKFDIEIEPEPNIL